MIHRWGKAVARARQLNEPGQPANLDGVGEPAAGQMLRFYERLLGVQAEIHDRIRARRPWLPSGALVEDIPAIRPLVPLLLEMVAAAGPPALQAEARTRLAAAEAGLDGLLLRYWHAPSGDQFFAKAFLQPFMTVLAETGTRPAGRGLSSANNNCPFCSGRPQLAVLHPMIVGDAAPGRSLQCATCLSSWPFRRVVCANCGEEREDKLPYFHSTDHDHVRIEACDTCGQYLKGIDLSRLGLAVPIVDEAAAAVLDVWAREHGYTKVELNLLGM